MTTIPMPQTIAAAAIALSLVGCGGGADSGDDGTGLDPAAVAADVSRGTGIDPTTHAGSFQMKVAREQDIAGTPVPLVVYAGLSAAEDTRLAMNVFADLRSLQVVLPEILSGPLEESCKRSFTLDFDGAEADGSNVRAWGSVLARFTSCNRRGDEGERPGVTLLSQRVDAVAVATAEVRGQCVEFILVDLELDPTGLLGGLSNLFGVTRLARAAILNKAAEHLKENPVCPDLPEELQALQPLYTDGGPREVGEGGMGAGLSGSIDTSAQTVVSLLALMQERGVLEPGQ